MSKKDSYLELVWGAALLDAGFTAVPNLILQNVSKVKLSDAELHFILQLLSYKYGPKSDIKPSYKTLAKKMGKTRRAVLYIAQRLEENGHLERRQRKSKHGGYDSTVFDLSPLLKLILKTENGGEDFLTLDSSDENVTRGGSEKFFTRGGSEENFTRGSEKFFTRIRRKEKKNNNSFPLSNSEVNCKKEPKAKKSSEKGKEKGKREKELFEKLRGGVHREDIFSTYDNLKDIKSIEELVEDAAYNASKSICRNNDSHLRKEFKTDYSQIDHLRIAEIVRKEFPYDKMPEASGKVRNFFVAAVCNLTAENISAVIES